MPCTHTMLECFPYVADENESLKSSFWWHKNACVYERGGGGVQQQQKKLKKNYHFKWINFISVKLWFTFHFALCTLFLISTPFGLQLKAAYRIYLLLELIKSTSPYMKTECVTRIFFWIRLSHWNAQSSENLIFILRSVPTTYEWIISGNSFSLVFFANAEMSLRLRGAHTAIANKINTFSFWNE